jgi:hypothetical protein
MITQGNNKDKTVIKWYAEIAPILDSLIIGIKITMSKW